jgi:sigma-B regulation protein RsbU (phosphoserine phosphatase)
VYTYFNQHIIYPLVAVALAEILLLPYVIVIASGDPQKSDKKKNKKHSEEETQSNVEVAEIKEEIEERYKSILAANNEMTTKVSTFFNNEDAQGAFLEYFNKLIAEKTNADGCAILLLDEFDNILAVKSLTGSFPPPYKLPEDLPHKPIRVETNFKFAQFPLIGNIFGSIVNDGKATNIKNPAKDNRIVKNGPEEFLIPGPYAFIPLKRDSETIGVVGLARKPGAQPFSDSEFETACTLTNAATIAMQPLNSFLAYAEHTELTKEGDIATKFQKTMLPEKMPVINKLSIGILSFSHLFICIFCKYNNLLTVLFSLINDIVSFLSKYLFISLINPFKSLLIYNSSIFSFPIICSNLFIRKTSCIYERP